MSIQVAGPGGPVKQKSQVFDPSHSPLLKGKPSLASLLPCVTARDCIDHAELPTIKYVTYIVNEFFNRA